jgi:8-oxo-dGTP pyrophosphatase MutT (NUDIX family)
MGKAKTLEQTQVAAIPYRIGHDGRVEVLLPTSGETRRWVIPKGWPMRGQKPRYVAEREALEEAGLVGEIIGKRPIGSYHYSKHLDSGEDLLCVVEVFLLWVDHQRAEWPEKEHRELRWVDPAQAAEMVVEGGLAEIMRRPMPATPPTSRRR